jgi:hypothetical protein
MPLRYRGLDPVQFQPLFALDDAELKRRGMERVTCDSRPGYPCRVTLEDAEPGETLLLLAFEHQGADSPYRAGGPIFVRENARHAYDSQALPPVFRPRTLSVRAYDADGMMVDAGLVEGAQAEPLFERLLARPGVAYLHVHNAKRGCFAARVERAA